MAQITQHVLHAKTRPRRNLKSALMLVISLATITFALPAHAELYKWVDEKGKVHFTDKPIHPSAETIEIEQQKMIGQDEAVRNINDRVKRLRQSEGETQAIEDESRAEQKAQADKTNSLCTRYKHKLTTLTGPIYRLNQDGERVFMTDDEILKNKAKLQRWIDQNC
ncbi:MAG: DUF4124 domain-containing protein [Gammaproteobacteria bacterium]|jgi:hypothetical protein|nr:DUF4124 domain-containing protein [Gammaproteobacteria bacterium]MBQ0773182.1 DUF4124 domain-containing protein [Gammaproteobacteria bacterium]